MIIIIIIIDVKQFMKKIIIMLEIKERLYY